MLNAGIPAPDFVLADRHGTQFCLNDLRGKWVALYFYPKDNTPGCTTEALQFSQSADIFKELNAVVIGISPDSCASHGKFIDKQNLTLLLLSDTEKKTLEQYDVWKLKTMYGKEYYGVERTTYLIDPQGNIAYVWGKVKVDGHHKEVLDKLRELSCRG
ncbi:MAG: thioredoxin-dependent thiol peroxidase [Candidatus Auribacterota bacterium]|nr:thioredoxin-dependent thiol peroxidase [Candidatus Auribacterota bacterium]